MCGIGMVHVMCVCGGCLSIIRLWLHHHEKALSTEKEKKSTMASFSTPKTASVDVARQIKELLKELPEERADSARLDELRRVFSKLIAQGDFDPFCTKFSDAPSSSSTHKWEIFLRESHKKMIGQLKDRISQGKRTAIRTLWGVVATSPASSSNGQYQLVAVPLLTHWIQAMALIPIWDQSIHHMVQVEFLQPYRDVQYYSMIAVRQVADEWHQLSRKKKSQKGAAQQAAERLLQILMLIPLAKSQNELDENSNAFLFPAPDTVIPDEESDVEDESDTDDDDGDDEEESVNDDESSDNDSSAPSPKRRKVSRPRVRPEIASSHANQWSRAWLAVLRLELPSNAIKQALQFLPTHVLPYVSNPLLFAEFFIRAYQYNGVTPILALDGLFILMTQHGLEYPDYYSQLYKLVTPTLFYVRYRTKFFRLLDRSVSRNELLPAQTVAAFVKRLLRASLQAPPAGIMTALALSSNWLRKHPETSVLIHAASTTPMEDPFDVSTDNPSASKAIQSSLWELQSLSQHYYPAVGTLAAAVGSPEQDKAPLLDLEEFYQQSYHSLFEQERKRQKRSKKTPLTFRKPETLFPSSDVFADILKTP